MPTPVDALAVDHRPSTLCGRTCPRATSLLSTGRRTSTCRRRRANPIRRLRRASACGDRAGRRGALAHWGGAPRSQRRDDGQRQGNANLLAPDSLPARLVLDCASGVTRLPRSSSTTRCGGRFHGARRGRAGPPSFMLVGSFATCRRPQRLPGTARYPEHRHSWSVSTRRSMPPARPKVNTRSSATPTFRRALHALTKTPLR